MNTISKTSEKGSLTVEAAAVLPVFMLGMLTLVSVLLMLLSFQRMQASLFITAQDLAEEYQNDADEEYISLVKTEDMKPLTDFFGMLSVRFERKCLAHAWCGYTNPYCEEGYVYITDDSEVYHLSRDCTHIKLTIEEISPGEVKSRRNSNGNRYRPCSICHSALSDEKLFITPEGDRYHNSITCSGLKRTVRAIRLSEKGDRRPCSRCGR